MTPEPLTLAEAIEEIMEMRSYYKSDREDECSGFVSGALGVALDILARVK